MTWHAVNAEGYDLSTGRRPRPLAGRPSPAAALAAAPVAPWPLAVVADDGRRIGMAEALGPGGDRVKALLDALVAGVDGVDVGGLGAATPAGPVPLPLAVVPLPDGVEALARLDPAWLVEVESGRSAPRQVMVAAGRHAEMEAALHVALLVGTERLDPADDADVDAHVASGAQLWLLAGAVVSALVGAEPDPFGAWARLVAAGWWPVGPSGGRLVVSRPS